MSATFLTEFGGSYLVLLFNSKFMLHNILQIKTQYHVKPILHFKAVREVVTAGIIFLHIIRLQI